MTDAEKLLGANRAEWEFVGRCSKNKAMPPLERVLFISFESDHFGHISSRDLFEPCYKSAQDGFVERWPANAMSLAEARKSFFPRQAVQ